MLPSLINPLENFDSSAVMYNCTIDLAHGVADSICNAFGFCFFEHPVCSELKAIIEKAESCFRKLRASGAAVTEKNLKIDLMRKDLAETCKNGQLKKIIVLDPAITRARGLVYEELVALENILKLTLK